ncbi:MAG TPA: 30S ribosomal protein S4 [Planctomycetes bacterium]|nr:30S ribosomal protein S4 [Planctomycetota bacterium]HIN80065.1 30S ribosomal protein S4 [Planctomycetota bacterium]
MARYTGPKCKLCRREGDRLFLKGARCHTAKCAISKRAYPPGMHNFRRSRLSEYGTRLREKQKTKRIYGVLEKQFRKYFEEAERLRGNTGENLLVLLERRLDNTVFSLGFADSRAQARQLIAHGHIAVGGRKLDIPSYLVRVGDVVGPRGHKKSEGIIREKVEAHQGRNVPTWLILDPKKLTGTVTQFPSREDVSLPIQEAYIVEFCSR